MLNGSRIRRIYFNLNAHEVYTCPVFDCGVVVASRISKYDQSVTELMNCTIH